MQTLSEEVCTGGEEEQGAGVQLPKRGKPGHIYMMIFSSFDLSSHRSSEEDYQLLTKVPPSNQALCTEGAVAN